MDIIKLNYNQISMGKGEKGEYEKERDREREHKDRDKERERPDSRSRSRSRSKSYKKRRGSDSPDRKHSSNKGNNDKYYRRSRSPRMRYRRKTSRENSAENVGKHLTIYINKLTVYKFV
jgi:hypothetical protein